MKDEPAISSVLSISSFHNVHIYLKKFTESSNVYVDRKEVTLPAFFLELTWVPDVAN